MKTNNEKKQTRSPFFFCNYIFFFSSLGLKNLSIFPVADVPHRGVMEVVTWRAISPHIEGVTSFSPGGSEVKLPLLFSAYLNYAVTRRQAECLILIHFIAFISISGPTALPENDQAL